MGAIVSVCQFDCFGRVIELIGFDCTKMIFFVLCFCSGGGRSNSGVVGKRIDGNRYWSGGSGRWLVDAVGFRFGEKFELLCFIECLNLFSSLSVVYIRNQLVLIGFD